MADYIYQPGETKLLGWDVQTADGSIAGAYRMIGIQYGPGADATGSANEARVYIGTAAGSTGLGRVAVYDPSNNLLGVSDEITLTLNSWNSFVFQTPIPITVGLVYKVFLWGGGSAARIGEEDGQPNWGHYQSFSDASDYPAFPDPCATSTMGGVRNGCVLLLEVASSGGSDTHPVDLTAEGSGKEVIQNAAGEQTGLWEHTTNTAAADDQLEVPNQTTGGVTAELQSDGHVNYSGVPGPGPKFSSAPNVIAKTTTTITVRCPVTTSTTVYGSIVPTGTKGPPDSLSTGADNVRAGLAPDGTAATNVQSSTGTGNRDLVFTGLTESTTYDWYVTPGLQSGDTLPGVREYDDSGAADAKWQTPADATITWYEAESYTAPTGTEATDALVAPPTFSGPDIGDQSDTVDSAITPLDVSGSFTEGTGTLTPGYSAANLPTGLTIAAATGVISGTPTVVEVPANCTVSLQTTDGGPVSSNAFTWTVNAAPVPPTFTGNIPNQTNDKDEAVNYDASTEFDEGTGTLTPGYSATGLPTGLTIAAATGVITGSVATAGVTSNITVNLQTTDGGPVSSNPFSWTINETEFAPVFSGPIPSPQTVFQNVAFSRDYSTYFTLQDTAPPVSYSATGLPWNGLSIDTNTGVVSGTPTALGDSGNITITCTNAQGSDTSNTFIFSAVVQPAIDPDDTWSGWQRVEDDRWEATNLNTGAVIEIVRKAQPVLLPSGSYERYEGYVDTVLQNPTEEWPRKSWHGMQSYLKQTGWYP